MNSDTVDQLAVGSGGEGGGVGVREREASDPALRILQAIRRMMRGISTHSKRLAHETGLTVPQVVCLQAIAEGPADGLSISELAKRVSLSPGTASRVIERLVRAGLVERRRRARDRRLVAASLTPQGRRRMESMPPLFHDGFLERLQSLSVEERRQIQATLDRIVDLMQVGDVDASPILSTEVDLGEDG